MWQFGTGGYGSVTINAVHLVLLPQDIPKCGQCAENTLDRLYHDGKPCCKRCAFVLGAPRWLDAAFTAVKPEKRAALYRQLSAVFHPDMLGQRYRRHDCGARKHAVSKESGNARLLPNRSFPCYAVRVR